MRGGAIITPATWSATSAVSTKATLAVVATRAGCPAGAIAANSHAMTSVHAETYRRVTAADMQTTIVRLGKQPSAGGGRDTATRTVASGAAARVYTGMMTDRDATYDLATYLQQTMAEKAVSVRELAEIADLDPNLISRVLRGASKLSLQDARKIADGLDVPYQTIATLVATD